MSRIAYRHITPNMIEALLIEEKKLQERLHIIKLTLDLYKDYEPWPVAGMRWVSNNNPRKPLRLRPVEL